ncbi:MAG: hypothetical protein ABH950_02880 [Candidatus Altiarchaeota archaeon]
MARILEEKRITDSSNPQGAIIQAGGLPTLKYFLDKGKVLAGGLSLGARLTPTIVKGFTMGQSLAGARMNDLGMHVSLRGFALFNLWSKYTGVPLDEIQGMGTYEILHFFKEYVHLVDDALDGGISGEGKKLPTSGIKSDELNRISVSH